MSSQKHSDNSSSARDASVEELIAAWQDGDLTLDEGEVSHVGQTTIEVQYAGTNGSLSVTYSLAEELTYRTDTEQPKRFNLLEEEPHPESS